MEKLKNKIISFTKKNGFIPKSEVLEQIIKEYETLENNLKEYKNIKVEGLDPYQLKTENDDILREDQIEDDSFFESQLILKNAPLQENNYIVIKDKNKNE
ncbi:MAG: hypothetical protein E7Y34_01035 [Mycoplasma sp.]|nr:hypothetical protein [Mycoplasma sp.]